MDLGLERVEIKDYPTNLLNDIVDGEWRYDYPVDFEGSLYYVIAGLSRSESIVVRKFYIEGKSYREISSEIGWSISYVGELKRRAIKKLKCH